MDANRPIAPQISALRRAFLAKKPQTGTIAASGPASRPLISGRNLLGCHGISSAKEGLGRPQPGSALHHLVTALSVKKALMNDYGFCALSRAFSSEARTGSRQENASEQKIQTLKMVMRAAHTQVEMQAGT
ncbi:hypothetical protein V1283_000522 [Bradyrhizobium sp. AZCC 2262]|uniref:hypothetical protein n=1 Tax=Bradyrhizobium sp. AZCC 2262 TaxID=3117022 RepID=UPI002FF2C721